MEILNHITGEVLYSNKKIKNMKELVIKAIERGKDLGFADFRGIDLSGVEFYYTFLRNANFENANLQDVLFKSCHADYANFKDSNLYQVKIESGDYNNADFSGANMEKSHLWDLISLLNANMTNVNFKEAEIARSILENVNLTGANMTGARLYSVFKNVKLMNTVNLDLTGVDFRKETDGVGVDPFPKIFNHGRQRFF